MNPRATIRDATPADVASIVAIYDVYVRGSTVTFEVEPVDATAMAARIDDVQARGLPWLVADEDGDAIGYAYATPWKARAAYARTVETSIYLAEAAQARGIGKALYGALVERLRAAGMHALIGGVSLPNPASVRLHEALGFQSIGTFREVGFKLGRWIDVGYWQRVLPGLGDTSSSDASDGG